MGPKATLKRPPSLGERDIFRTVGSMMVSGPGLRPFKKSLKAAATVFWSLTLYKVLGST